MCGHVDIERLLRAAACILRCGGARTPDPGTERPATRTPPGVSPGGLPCTLGLDTAVQSSGRRAYSTAVEPDAFGGGYPYRALGLGRASGDAG